MFLKKSSYLILLENNQNINHNNTSTITNAKTTIKIIEPNTSIKRKAIGSNKAIKILVLSFNTGFPSYFILLTLMNMVMTITINAIRIILIFALMNSSISCIISNI